MNAPGKVDLEAVSRILQRDVLDEVEKTCGPGSVDSNEVMQSIALLNHIAHVAEKNDLLHAIGDTVYNDKLDRYIRIVEDLGFEKVLEVAFKVDSDESKSGRNEKFFVYARRDGILLAFDTYQEVGVNASEFYYNLAFKKYKDIIGLRGSGITAVIH
jgi:hypothetical protein